MCVCVCLCMPGAYSGIQSSGTGVTDDCKLHVDAGNQTWVFWKRTTEPSLNYVSRPVNTHLY